MREAFTATIVASFAILAHAQDAQPPRFRSGVEVVQLDVIVLDRARIPVRGLTAADFTVLEDGTPQQIVAFSEVEVPEPDAPPGTWLHDVPWDIRRNDDDSNRRVMMIVINDGQLPRPDMAVHARTIARGIVDRLGPGDLASIVFTMDNSHAQDFTTDRRRLLAAIDSLHAGQLPPFLAERYPLQTILSATEYLGQIAQRRKVLVCIGSIPVALASAGTPDDEGDASYKQFLVAEIIEKARRGNVSIYTFSPSGLVATPPAERADTDEALKTLSANTGGTAVTDTNRVDPRVARMFRENNAYYVIGYQASNSKTDGKFRKLQVRVNRPGVEVRARGGYDAPKPPKADRGRPARDAALAPLSAALAGLLPTADLPVQVTAAPFRVPGKREAAIAVVVALRHPPPKARTVGRVELLVAAFGAEGQTRATRRQTVQVVLRPVEGASTQLEVLSRVDLKPGWYHLRVSATDPVNARAGSVYYDLSVPDFSKGEVSLSGIVLSATPAVASAGREQVAPLVPVAPTSQRFFIASDRVMAFLQVYDNCRTPCAVQLVSRIENAAGETVFRVIETLAPERFAKGRAANFLFEVPVAKLSTGPHLLVFEATGARAAPVRRDIRFTIR